MHNCLKIGYSIYRPAEEGAEIYLSTALSRDCSLCQRSLLGQQYKSLPGVGFLRSNLPIAIYLGERAAKWLRHLTRKPKVRTAVSSNPVLDSLVAVRNSSPGQPEPCEGNLVAVAD